MKCKNKYILLILPLCLVYVLILKTLGLPGCLLNTLTNIQCPGCGGTRMLESILKGELYQAFRYNPFLFITLPLFALALMLNVNKERKWFSSFLIIYAVLLVSFGVLRNFITVLQPTTIL